uniref:Uncharacterized protein n=1 Tax=Acrobeloides nanus TaxID=290746 RepID=A0A914C6U7_9BILA
MHEWLIPIFFFLVQSVISNEKKESGCGMNDFMTCIAQLKSDNVPIDTNIMNIVFEHSVTSEARLLRICGNEKQKARLAEVNRLLLFICAPFSLQRQKTLLKVGKCIGKVLKMPVKQDCAVRERKYGYKLDLCRRNCNDKELICKRRIRMSELAACSVIAIEQHCGNEAEEFYTGMQSAIIGDEFPIQCKYKELSFPKLLDADLPSQTSKPSLFGDKKATTQAVEDIPLLVPKNGKLVPNPVLTRKALEMLQFERKTLHSRPASDLEEEKMEKHFDSGEKFRIKNIRSRNFGADMFKPAKFDESKLRQVPEPEPNSPMKIQIYENGNAKLFGGMSTNKSTVEVSTHDFLPIFLQGARPIPDASMTIFASQPYKKGIPLQGTLPHYDANRLVQDNHARKFTVFGTTIPVTSKWIPWYYETVLLTTPSYQLTTSPPPPPVFPYFNAFNHINNEMGSQFSNNQLTQNGFVNMPPNQLPPIQDAFPNHVVYPTTTPSFMNHWPTTAAPLFQWHHSQAPQMTTLSPNLLSNIKETADNYLAAAFHALNNQQTEMLVSNLGNQTTSGALSRLFSTIERVSPKIIENIRSKLDSLGKSK